MIFNCEERAKITMEAENRDRILLLEKLKKAKNILLAKADRQHAKLFFQNPLRFVWIEQPDPTENLFWTQKDQSHFLFKIHRKYDG